jgi:hypothetical protein
VSGANDQSSARVNLDVLHFGVRDAIELIAETHLPKDVDAAPLQSFAPEGASEIAVRFEHRNPNAATG